MRAVSVVHLSRCSVAPLSRYIIVPLSRHSSPIFPACMPNHYSGVDCRIRGAHRTFLIRYPVVPLSRYQYAAAITFADDALRPPGEKEGFRRVLMNKIMVACGRAGPDHYEKVGSVRSVCFVLRKVYRRYGPMYASMRLKKHTGTIRNSGSF